MSDGLHQFLFQHNIHNNGKWNDSFIYHVSQKKSLHLEIANYFKNHLRTVLKWLYILWKSVLSQTHIHVHKCSLKFDMCGMINFVRDVIWICKDRINTQIPIVFIQTSHKQLGTSRFLHSCKQCLFIQAWTTYHTKNDTKRFWIKHSFIWCIITYCSYMIFKIISNFLGVNFFLTLTVKWSTTKKTQKK